MSRGALALSLLVLGCGLPLVLACGPERLPQRPHLILISIDTLRQDALRAFSAEAPELPTLDRLAAESALFAGALAPASWTLPAHAALLTGLHPDRAGGSDRRVGLAEGAPRLAEGLRAAGYETLAFTDGGYLDARFGFGHGFDRYDAQADGDASSAALPRGGAPTRIPGASLFDRAVAALGARSADGKPLFLFLQTYSVHDYFQERPWAAQALGGRRPNAAKANLACLVGRRRCPPAQWERLRALYRAELAHLEAGFARLDAVLRSGGWLERSVVVLLSDHGEGFEPGRARIHHGGRLDPDLLRVPLLFRGPEVAPGPRAAAVSLVDVAPTLLELAGAPIPERLDGLSLVPQLRDAAAALPARALLAMEHFHYWQAGARHEVAAPRSRPLAIAVIEGDLWFQQDEQGERVQTSGEPDPARVAALRRRAAERGAGAAAAASREPLDADLRARLEALGYVEE